MCNFSEPNFHGILFNDSFKKALYLEDILELLDALENLLDYEFWTAHEWIWFVEHFDDIGACLDFLFWIEPSLVE